MVWMTCLVCAWLEGQIVECGSFRELNAYMEEETLLILDIDDTLLVPIQMLGCDEWFVRRWQGYQQSGMDSKVALEKALAEWEAIRHLTKMELVEEGTAELVRELQEQGLRVMGLTTQGLALATRTRLQLREKGIDLAQTAPGGRDVFFLNGDHGVLFRQGILFTSGTHKGEALFHLCREMGYEPKRIVFVNDKASHLLEMEKSAESRGIDFLGLRYGFSDVRKRAFRPEIADYQFAYSSFARILSDEEAMAALDLNFTE
jgi:hypothetical protein